MENTQQLSFHLIQCPTGGASPPAHLVVSGCGVPHEPLTRFYEAVQAKGVPEMMQRTMRPLLSFFSFMEQNTPLFPSSMLWARSPSEIQETIRCYLHAQWGCRTRQEGKYEILLLPSFMRQEKRQIRRFLTALQWFYRFSLERQDYWYAGNPADVFRFSLCSRLLWGIKHVKNLGLPQS